MTDIIRVLIVDDHPLVREGLQAVMLQEPDMVVIGEAANGREAVPKVVSLQPDVILMDLLMPGMSGGQAINAIRQQAADSRILVLTSVEDVDTILGTIKAGAQGYVSKDAPPDELLEAIRTVHRGSVVLPAAVAQALLNDAPRRATATHPADVLTEREVEVLTLVAQGMNNDDIAERLVISPRTVSVHVSRILTKLDLDNRTQAALHALKTGLATLQG